MNGAFMVRTCAHDRVFLKLFETYSDILNSIIPWLTWLVYAAISQLHPDDSRQVSPFCENLVRNSTNAEQTEQTLNEIPRRLSQRSIIFSLLWVNAEWNAHSPGKITKKLLETWDWQYCYGSGPESELNPDSPGSVNPDPDPVRPTFSGLDADSATSCVRIRVHRIPIWNTDIQRTTLILVPAVISVYCICM